MTPSEFEACLGPLSGPVAVATSGGPDSLALLLFAQGWAQKNNQRIVALTVNHGLRPEAEAEALHVQKWAHARGIEHVILRWEGKKPLTRIQEHARKARYDLLLGWCKSNEVPTLLLGHHQQDQEETFWYRLVSGSGLEGLASMRERVVCEGILLLRPLLKVPKESLKAILKVEGETWFEDPSNNSSSYFRGRLRGFMEEEGLTAPRLGQVITKFQEDADFIHLALQQALEETVHVFEEGYFSLHKERFNALHPALSKRVIIRLMRWFSGAPYPPRSRQVEQIVSKMKASEVLTAGGIYWLPKQNKILVLREPAAQKESLPLAPLIQPFLWDNRFWVNPQIKKFLPAEAHLAPLGETPYPRAEIPSYVRKSLPALWAKGKIVSVPHLCYTGEDGVNLRNFFCLKPFFMIR